MHGRAHAELTRRIELSNVRRCDELLEVFHEDAVRASLPFARCDMGAFVGSRGPERLLRRPAASGPRSSRGTARLGNTTVAHSVGLDLALVERRAAEAPAANETNGHKHEVPCFDATPQLDAPFGRLIEVGQVLRHRVVTTMDVFCRDRLLGPTTPRRDRSGQHCLPSYDQNSSQAWSLNVVPTVLDPAVLQLEDNAVANIKALAVSLRGVALDANHAVAISASKCCNSAWKVPPDSCPSRAK